MHGRIFVHSGLICHLLALNHHGLQSACAVALPLSPLIQSSRSAIYSRCSTTVKPINPIITVFSQGYSLSRMVPYPTNGIYPTTLPTTSCARSRNCCPRAYNSVSSAALLSPLVSSFNGFSLCLGLAPNTHTASHRNTYPPPKVRTTRCTIGMSLPRTL